MKHLTKNSFDLVWLMAKTDFKLRYQGSVLGFLWALLKPLFLFGILYLVFSNFFGQQTPYYSLQLLTGIFLWSFFAEGTTVGLTSLQNKAHLLTKIYFPRWIVVVASTFQSLLSLIINLFILLIVILVSGVPLSFWQITLFGFYLILLYGIVLGFSFFAAPFFLRFRDVNQIWEVLLMGGFYAAPIIYPLSALPNWLQQWVYLNPMTFLIEHVRGVLFLGSFSRLDHHVLYVSMVLSVLIFGVWFFKRYEKRVIELL